MEPPTHRVIARAAPCALLTVFRVIARLRRSRGNLTHPATDFPCHCEGRRPVAIPGSLATTLFLRLPRRRSAPPRNDREGRWSAPCFQPSVSLRHRPQAACVAQPGEARLLARRRAAGPWQSQTGRRGNLHRRSWSAPILLFLLYHKNPGASMENAPGNMHFFTQFRQPDCRFPHPPSRSDRAEPHRPESSGPAGFPPCAADTGAGAAHRTGDRMPPPE